MNSLITKLGIISFFGDLSSQMLYPITPVFVTSVLGASMTSLGLIEGCAEAISSILRIYSGMWSDRIRLRKPFIVIGYVFASLAKPMTGMATSWIHVLLARSFDRIGKGLRTSPRDAMLSESVEVKDRGFAFGIHRAMDTMGAAIGPLFALLFLAYYEGSIRTIFYIAFIPGLISVWIALSIQEKRPAEKKVEKIDWSWKRLPSSYRNYLVAWTFFSLTNSSDVFLLMKVNEAGGSLPLTIVLFIFYNLLYALLSPYFGKKSDSIPRKTVLIFGLIIFAVVHVGFSFSSRLWEFWIWFGLYGVFMASTEGVGKALAVDLFDSRLKATAIGILGMTTGIATILASTITGFLWDHFGSSWAFLYSASGAVLGAWILARKI